MRFRLIAALLLLTMTAATAGDSVEYMRDLREWPIWHEKARKYRKLPGAKRRASEAYKWTITRFRIRDFRGLSRKSFDGRGNYSLGLAEQIVFPEIDIDSQQFVQGMDIAIVTTAPNDAMASDLLEWLGTPFKK